MPVKKKIIKVERPAENSDILIETEFTAVEWSLVNAYFDENMNQTRAYLKVFPNAGYESARVEGSKAFAKPNIKNEIIYRLKQEAMSATEVLKRLGDMARASHQSFIKIANDGFIYFDFSNPEAVANLHLIKKIKTKRERRIEGSGESAEEWEGEWVEVELHDAAAALRDLGRYYKLFTDKVDLTSNGETMVSKEDNERFDRALLTLSDALGAILSNTGTGTPGKVDAPK